MAYEKTDWVNNQTPLNEDNLNKLEQGVKDAHDDIAQHELEIETVKEAVYNDHALRISTNEEHIEQGDLREAELKARVDIIQPQHEELLAGIGKGLNITDTVTEEIYILKLFLTNGQLGYEIEGE